MPKPIKVDFQSVKGNAAHAGKLHGAMESRGLSFCRDETGPLEVHFLMRSERKRPQIIGAVSYASGQPVQLALPG